MAIVAAGLGLPGTADGFDLSDLPTRLRNAIDRAAQACSDLDNGQFALEWGAVERADLDGDMTRDWVLNESFFACSSAVSLYCGTGGCVSHFLVGDVLISVLNQGWDVVDFGRHRVLLTEVHGTRCGGDDRTPCVTARTWDQETAQWHGVPAGWE